MYKIIGADHKEYGPSTDEEIRQWVAEGRANGQTLVKLEGQSEWKHLASLPEFAGLTFATASPPYFTGAPPPLATPQNPQAFPASVLDFDQSLPIGVCLKSGWKMLKNNFGLLFSATFVICLIRLFLSAIPLVNIVAMLFTGVFYGGLYRVFLRRIRNQPATVADAFSGFGANFVQLLLVGIISLLLISIGFLFCFIPGIYLYVAWVFAVPLVADKQLGFWDAMELSRKVVTRRWIPIALLLVISFLPVILFAIYTNILSMNFISSLMQSNQLDPALLTKNPSEFFTQMEHAGRLLTEKYGYLAFIQLLILFLVQPFAKGVLMCAYEILFNPRATPPA